MMREVDSREIYSYLKMRHDERRKLEYIYDFVMRKINISAFKYEGDSIIVDDVILLYREVGKGYDGSRYVESDKIQMFNELERIFNDAFYDEEYCVHIVLKNFIKGCFIIKVIFEITSVENKKDDVLL